MNKVLRVSILLLFLAFVIILFLLVRPATINRENSIEVKAVVTGVSEGGLKDIVISLKDARDIYYINKGIEKGLNVDDLNKKLIKKSVTILYAKPRMLSRFGPMTDTRFITELRLDKEMIYSEFLSE